ncbi:response regulator [bacterium]|nr:response regulator [bacterium]
MPPKVLIVDDENAMRLVIRKALEPLGLSLHFSSDGIHALDALRCNPGFDLLITDISMPVVDGRQLIATIRADKSMAQIPILITSGVVGVHEIADLLDIGATRFVAKPINAASFREDVTACLDLAPAAG